jgi:hypothetical protein
MQRGGHSLRFDGISKQNSLFPWQKTDEPIGIVDVRGRVCTDDAEEGTSRNSNRAQMEVTKDIVSGFVAAGVALDDIAILCTYK